MKDEGWATIEVELTPGADVRYLHANLVRSDDPALTPGRRRVLYSNLHRSRAGWFQPSDAATICFGLVESGVYRATVSERV